MVKKTGRSSDFSVTLKHDDIDQACQLLRSSTCNDVNSVASIPSLNLTRNLPRLGLIWLVKSWLVDSDQSRPPRAIVRCDDVEGDRCLMDVTSFSEDKEWKENDADDLGM